MRIALLGNCQVDPIRHMLMLANDSLEVTSYNVNNIRDETKQFELFDKLEQYDLVISQILKKEYNSISSLNVKASLSNAIFIPNLFFLGWHPDMTYIGGSSNRALGPTGEIHSLVSVLIAQDILDEGIRLNKNEIERKFVVLFNEFLSLHDSFNSSKQLLENRFGDSSFTFAEFNEIVGFEEPFMMTHNHPLNRALFGLIQLILDLIELKSTLPSQQLIDFTPNPLSNAAFWSPILQTDRGGHSAVQDRKYHVRKGVFLSNSEFVHQEVEALTKHIESVPQIRRPDIHKELQKTLIEFSKSL